MDSLLPHLRRHFDNLQERLLCFREQEVQVEGWFKGELLFLLTALRRTGTIQGFAREVGPPAKVDLAVTVAGSVHWVELKHWLVGVQRGVRLGPSFYFGDRTSVGVFKDCEKLAHLGESGSKWLCLLLTGNPGTEVWERGLSTFHRKFSPHLLIPYTNPDQFPNSYYLALLRLGRKDADAE